MKKQLLRDDKGKIRNCSHNHYHMNIFHLTWYYTKRDYFKELYEIIFDFFKSLLKLILFFVVIILFLTPIAYFIKAYNMKKRAKKEVEAEYKEKKND